MSMNQLDISSGTAIFFSICSVSASISISGTAKYEYFSAGTVTSSLAEDHAKDFLNEFLIGQSDLTISFFLEM